MIPDTTGFSRVELQFSPSYWEFLRLKLKLHAAEAGGLWNHQDQG
jgi:hypothetical protein